MRRAYDAEMHEYFNQAWAGAYFDIMAGVLGRFPDWAKDDQEAMVYMIVEQLADRVGLIELDEDEEATF
jgi:hypothetical protein